MTGQIQQSGQQDSRWHARDWLAAAALFVVTAGFVLWQNAHIAVLWDLSYLLDTSWRIALGQMPYRDFPLVHPPGTFLIQAVLMRIFGRSAWVPICYAALVGGAATVLSRRILLDELQGRMQGAWMTALALSAPLCFLSIYGVYPHPIYDCDCAFSVLVAIYLLLSLSGYLEQGRIAPRWLAIAAGVSVVAPCLFKQNIGLPFLLVLVAGAVLLLVTDWRRVDKRIQRDALLWMLAGAAVALLCGALLIQVTAGWANFWHWTVRFAGERRLPGLAPMLSNYRQAQLLWTAPALASGIVLLHNGKEGKAGRWLQIAGLGLAAAPFVAGAAEFFFADGLDDRADCLLALWPLLLLVAACHALYELRKGLSLRRLLPFLVLAAIHGTLLSQQLWGSTYAIWPLLLILVASLLGTLPAVAGWAAPALGGVIGVTFLVCGGLYAAGHDRLSYLQAINGSSAHATLPALRGLNTPGPYLGNFEELVRFADREIQRGDGILLLPGEEPFFFATGRVPHFPVQIFDRTTDPYSADELMAEANRLQIRWVIVKTRLQSDEDPLPEREQTVALVQSEYMICRQLPGYTVYRRR